VVTIVLTRYTSGESESTSYLHRIGPPCVCKREVAASCPLRILQKLLALEGCGHTIYSCWKQYGPRNIGSHHHTAPKYCNQSGIKGFAGPRHFSSVGPFGDSKLLLELQCTLDYPG
jgi:hypothetical protein